MTGKEYIDEVKLRLARHQVSEDFGDPLILTYVNDARREVQKMTMALYPDSYGKIARIKLTDNTGTPTKDNLSDQTETYIEADKPSNVYVATLPDDFIEAYVAILEWIPDTGQTDEGVTFRREMRWANKREIFNTQLNSWNGATIWNPVYSVDRQMNILAGVRTDATLPYIIYIHGLDIDATTTLFTIAATDIGGYKEVTAEVWYIAALPAIEMADDDTIIPPNFEEYVIYWSMLYCLQNINDMMAKDSVEAELSLLKKNLQELYEMKKTKKDLLIPSKENG